jgi:diguanylate cyclase (GGDEF)-like protein
MRKLDKALSAQTLTTYYVFALSVIGCLAIVSHLLQQRTLFSSRGYASVVNLSGRQRMLTQRMASLAAQYRMGDLSARAELLTAADELEENEARLSAPYRTSGRTHFSASLHLLYFGSPVSLDRETQEFVRAARTIAALSPTDPAAGAPIRFLFAEARAPLLVRVDQVVSLHQQEAEENVAALNRLQWILLLAMLGSLCLEALTIFRPMVRRIFLYSQRLLHLSTTDPLTGICNRAGFAQRAGIEVSRAVRHGHAVSLLFLDADHFKRVNDTYGHEGGDIVLKTIAEIITGAVRPSDIVARYGGEEFYVIAPETEVQGAYVLAERIRHQIAERAIAVPDGTLHMTVSIGVAPIDPFHGGLDAALQRADKLMYEAKRLGRNCTVLASSATMTSPRDRGEEEQSQPAILPS